MIRHFCASVFVIDPLTKKILLVKHPKFNKWVQPGGHIEENETPEETALREVYEETGIRVNILGDKFPRENDFVRPLGIQKNRSMEGNMHIDIIYAGVPIKQDNIKFDKLESQEFGWFSRNELENISVFPDIKITMDYILNNYIK
jgi:8-oxo-dGTP pyrophosphatase MutT (NUDIX family)